MFTVWSVLLGLAAAGVYAMSCWLWPYKRHDRCEGTGKLWRPSGKVFKLCTGRRGCGGTGRTLRTGRRVYNWAHQHKVDAR